ncbi:MAG: hypothetical protein IAE66_06315 [Xanthomonadaceae bacterium]|nr:hypothetical protein [Xanthomonadaceae bacterium]
MSCEWIGWCALKPAEQAAWIQAIGSLVAIGVAAYIPIRIARTENDRIRNERKYKARALAFVLKPFLVSMKQGLSITRYRWNENPIRLDEEDAIQLDAPSALSERLLDLDVLGQSGTMIQKAIVTFYDLKIGINSQLAHWRYGGVWVNYESGEEFELPETDVESLFSEASQAISEAIDSIDARFE